MTHDARDEAAGAHDAALPEGFVDFLTASWRDDPAPYPTPAPPAENLAKRRQQLSEAFPGDLLVVPTGGIRSRTYGAPYRFRSGSDFLWLAGDADPDSVLVMHPTATGHDAVLYAHPRFDARAGAGYLDRTHGELWHGPLPSLAEKAALLGVETRPLAELEGALTAPASGVRRVARGYDQDVDLLAGAGEAEADGELARVLSDLRLVKDDWELAQLQQAVDATVRAFEDVARRLPADRAVSERLLEGVIEWRARVEGAGVGYPSVIGGGPRSAILHWSRNEGTAAPGDVLLMDVGVENRHGYTADVTRVLPVSGRFSAVQREVYDIVHASRDAGLAIIRPGVAFREVHLTCMRVLAEGLHQLGLLPGSVDEAMHPDSMAYRRWSLHGFGHMLGLDVHDCGRARAEAYAAGNLEEGHVLTMEPGLYFQPTDELVPVELRGIGVRIEDDLVVTAESHRLLTAELPTQADEVEAWLAAQREAGPREPVAHVRRRVLDRP
ncbi:Xaa-Pro aminopeptidase [Nocardioides sp. Soil797]|nr:Xaa-Pro aminopeptidase [Nocardioides sp. Soil797]